MKTLQTRKNPWALLAPWRFAHWAWLALLSWSLGPTSAQAQSAWLVVDVTVGERPGSAAQRDEAATALRERGFDVIDGATAAATFERNHSRTPVQLQPEQVSKLDAALRALGDHLASENLPAARQALDEVEQLTPGVKDFLNREVTRARKAFRACLLAGHLFAKEGFDDEAFEQVRRCARDFPGFEPEDGPYLPDSIRKFFRAANEELKSIRPATITVDVATEVSEPCRARLNGIDRGAIPATISDIRAERVRIQVDCEPHLGRAYEKSVRAGRQEFRIDPQLDRAVRVSGGLGLNYADLGTADAHRLAHGVALGRAVGAAHVIQVAAGRTLYRIDVEQQRYVAEAPLESGGVREAIAAILREPGGSAQPALVADTDASRPPYATLGWVSAGAAVASLAGTVIAWQIRESAADDFNSEMCSGAADGRTRSEVCPSELNTAEDAETVMVATGIAAGVFAGLSVLFFVLDDGSDSEGPQARTCAPGPGEIGLACRVRF